MNDLKEEGSKFGPTEQNVWGVIGGLTPYAAALLKAIGYQTNYRLEFSWEYFLGLAIAAAVGILGSRLLDSHSKFTAWFHGGTFPLMLNFLFGETAIHASTHLP
jgi:hypothetical protein